MISMTGYGFAELQDERVLASVEVKSVNNRFLDLHVSLPGTLTPFDPEVRKAVNAFANRGRVEVSVRYRELTEEVSVRVDRTVLAAYLAAIDEIRSEAGIDEPLSLAALLGIDGLLRSERDVDRERSWSVVQPLLAGALEAFAEHRSTEGQRTQNDIAEQFARIKTALDHIRAHESEIEAQVRSQLQTRFREVVGDGVEEQRMLAEVAVQLTRFSIHEEIARLSAHIEAFQSTMSRVGAVGKKLDFICQEMHREINTIGSKSQVLTVSEAVVEAKDALENVREQLRNVE